jgi:hypothetical protein
MNELTSWQLAFRQWQKYGSQINARAKLITDARHDRGWALALTVGIPHDGCCLHNASIDDKLTGWCFNNPERLRVAKLANAIVNDWRASRVAERMVARKWNELLGALGAAKYSSTLNS